MTIKRWEGYHIVVGDQNGRIFYESQEERNMQRMWATGDLSLLHAFNGILEHFAFDNVYWELSSDYVRDFRDEVDILYNTRFELSDLVGESFVFDEDQEPID